MAPPHSHFKVTRRNIPLGDGYAFTDFFSQGMSFKEQPWLADMRKPPTGQVDRASVNVVLSRYPRWSAFKALASLWHHDQERRQVIAFYHRVARMDNALRTEMQRLALKATETEQRLMASFQHLLPQHLQPQQP